MNWFRAADRDAFAKTAGTPAGMQKAVHSFRGAVHHSQVNEHGPPETKFQVEYQVAITTAAENVKHALRNCLVQRAALLNVCAIDLRYQPTGGDSWAMIDSRQRERS